MSRQRDPKITTLKLHQHLKEFSTNIDKVSKLWLRSQNWTLESQHPTLEVATFSTVAKDGSQSQSCNKQTWQRRRDEHEWDVTTCSPIWQLCFILQAGLLLQVRL